MIFRFASTVLAVIVVLVASTATSVTVTASEQPLLQESDLKYDEDAIRSIQVDVPMSASGPYDTSQSRELNIADSSYEKEKSQDRITKLSGGTVFINVGAVAETEMKDEKLKKSKGHDRALYDDCTDDESFQYQYINKKGKSKIKGGCTDFIGRKKKKRCRKWTIDRRKVRDVCRSTCGTCKKKKKEEEEEVCSMDRFIGSWQYSTPCGGGGVFELTVRCDDKMKKHNKCYVGDKKVKDATDDGDLVDIKEDDTCVTEGVVDTKDVVYNSVTGNCLLPFVGLDGGTSCDTISEGFGVKAEIAAAPVSDKMDAAMNIKFSRDEGRSYYNEETPYEGYFVPSDGSGRSLLSTSLNIGNVKRRVLSKTVEYGSGETIDIGGYYRERCDSWNRQTDPKNFPTSFRPELYESGFNRLSIKSNDPDEADASFQRCFEKYQYDDEKKTFRPAPTGQFCWSNSAEYERVTLGCGETVSKHIHCRPSGLWYSSESQGVQCGKQCSGFSVDSSLQGKVPPDDDCYAENNHFSF